MKKITLLLMLITAGQCLGQCTYTYSSTNVTCFGACDGTATVLVSGGMMPYTFTWSSIPPQMTQTATGLCPFIYQCIVQDAIGFPCIPTGTPPTITEPPQLTISVASSNASCSSCCDGTMSAPIVSGGTAPYSYTLSCGPTSTLCPGTYICCVTDNNGCLVCDTSVISYPTSVYETSVTADVTFYPNPFSNTTTLYFNSSSYKTSAELILFNYQGKIVTKYILEQPMMEISRNDLEGGLYFYRIQNTDGLVAATGKIVIN
jgi:hypothetical protein